MQKLQKSASLWQGQEASGVQGELRQLLKTGFSSSTIDLSFMLEPRRSRVVFRRSVVLIIANGPYNLYTLKVDTDTKTGKGKRLGKRIGATMTAYEPQLASNMRIHDVFYVKLLKPYLV